MTAFHGPRNFWQRYAFLRRLSLQNLNLASLPRRIAQFAAQKFLVDEYAAHPYVKRERFIITDLVFERLPADETFVILDGGGRDGPGNFRWRAIGDERLVIYGFEVDHDECAQLNETFANSGQKYRYFPVALWGTRQTITVHENNSPGGGSVFNQNVSLTNRWKFADQHRTMLAPETFFPTNAVDFPATTIDDWAGDNGVSAIDFLKLNVQAAELEILKGASSILPSVLGLQIEVSFVESYLGRPFFSDIDPYLRARGFHFFDLVGRHYIGRARSPVTPQQTPKLAGIHGQLIEGHAVYFRDPIADASATISTERIMKLASIAEIYGQVEYALEILEWLAEKLCQNGERERAAEIVSIRSEALARYERYMGAKMDVISKSALRA